MADDLYLLSVKHHHPVLFASGYHAQLAYSAPCQPATPCTERERESRRAGAPVYASK